MDPKDEIKRRIDIVDIVGEQLVLKPSSTNSFIALCPFHEEKTPSFHVSREKQIWHCFGCGEGGDLFAFLMRMEGMEFSEALRVLAKRAGVEVPRFVSTESNRNQHLVELNAYAATWYAKWFCEASEAASARAYANKRGISQTLTEKFNIGAAPDAWDGLVRALEKKRFSFLEAEQAGLVLRRRSGSGYIDRFRHRLMIPLRNVRGETVGFAGRLLPSVAPQTDGSSAPKYVNSPETSVYRKGEFLFGLDLAKRAIKEKKSVVIVEGNLDVVASHKAGVEHVVASSGTAFTQSQLEQLRRLTDTLIFAFDQDAAGFQAARRGINLARDMDFQIKIALLPSDAGKDPDEAVQKDPALWQDAVEHTVPVMQYFVERIMAGRDLSSPDAKREAANLLIPELAMVKHVIEREHWLQMVADWLHVDIGVLRHAVDQYGNTRRSSESVQMVAPKVQPSGMFPIVESRSRRHAAAEAILAACLHMPDFQGSVISCLTPDHFPNGFWRELYTFLVPDYTKERFSPSAEQTSYIGWIRGILSGEPRYASLLSFATKLAILGETLFSGLSSSEASRQLDEHIGVLDRLWREDRRKTFEAAIRRAEAQGDQETVTRLLREYHSL
ncbi:MAG: primase protein [Candidatus Uhrbacteria bacterium GW2011_GWF2_41_16]|jgi:DNA primase|uniref:DNA primase n=2 Tax=Candidatus Uhriibacteriota TaxID=1752732 RepID=A0A0G0VF12_9BACT|nr:MAG: primase protein [Candidatus Uhrbacteria bacterium GW2011_GWC2_41_11]KKR98246.1 MAG: primase protein [Candidatus Uhrbacteria bacterium GW2011_GWF2_41_16]HBO99839.1 DNA primase [Candidatus Uhrbacteria bacterium]